MSPIGRKLVQMMDQEQENMKLTAVDDALRLARQSFGFGMKGYEDVMSNAGQWFDKYFEMDIEAIHTEIESMSAENSKFAQDLHFNNQRITRLLRDDEQDFED